MVKGLQSIRFPGPTTFFRPVDSGVTTFSSKVNLGEKINKKLFQANPRESELITWAKLRALRAEKTIGTKLVHNTELPKIEKSKALVIPESTLVETPSEQITITIKPEIKYVQIFPCNLDDCTFEIKGGDNACIYLKNSGASAAFYW